MRKLNKEELVDLTNEELMNSSRQFTPLMQLEEYFKSLKEKEKPKVIVTGFCKKLQSKYQNFADKVLKYTPNPFQPKISETLSETSIFLNKKLLKIDSSIVETLFKNKVLLEILSSSEDVAIMIPSNNPILATARDLLGIENPIDKDYSRFLEANKTIYKNEDRIRKVEEGITKKAQELKMEYEQALKKAEDVRTMYREVQNKEIKPN